MANDESTVIAPTADEVSEVDDDIWEKPDDESSMPEEDIEMPPDVIALYESGIITAEEFEGAKKKYREQRNK